MDLLPLLTGPGAALVFALVVLYGGKQKWWVFGWAYRDCVTEKNEWKEAALRGTRVAERAVVTIQEATSAAGRDDAQT